MYWSSAAGAVSRCARCLPQDGPVLQAFVRNLSPESRRLRFMGGVSELPAALLERLTRIDYCSHLALIGEFFPDGVETVIAEARYAVEPGEDAVLCLERLLPAPRRLAKLSAVKVVAKGVRVLSKRSRFVGIRQKSAYPDR